MTTRQKSKPIRAILVADRLCALSDWTLAFQAVHGMTLFAHGLHVARTGRPLSSEPFLASAMGVRAESVTRHVRGYGGDAVTQPGAGRYDGIVAAVLGRFEPVGPLVDPVMERAVSDTHAATRDWSPARWVAETHEAGGPWDLTFREGREVAIPHDVVVRWARARFARIAEA